MRTRQLITIALLVAGSASAALAGVIYAPAAYVNEYGTVRSTQLVLSNTDPALPRAVSVRFIEEGVAGLPLPAGGFPIYWTAPGATSIQPLPPSLVPAGKAGLLEVFPGSGAVVVGSRLVYEKAGVYSSSVDIPAVSSASVRPAGASVYLQGVEDNTALGTLTDLALFNLGVGPAACTMNVRSGTTGAALALGVPFTVAAMSSAMVTDAFGPANLNRQVPANSWAQVTCNRPFWAFAVRHNVTYGGVRAILPSDSLAQSTLVQPGSTPPPPPPPPPGGQFNFRLPGTFLACTPGNRFWRTNLVDGRVAGRTFRRIVVDFDVYHHSWDPNKKTHIYMWLQNGTSWSSSLFGYLIASKTAHVMRFQIKYGANTQQDSGPSGQPGGIYHVRYEWNGITRRASFVMTTQGGQVRASKTINMNRGNFTVNGMFLATGSWPTGDGPEALQYGWQYGNLNVDYFP